MTLEQERSRAIIIVAHFADGSRRAKACASVEEARAFIAGEHIFAGRHPYREEIGRATRVESRTDLGTATRDEIVDGLRKALAR